MWHRNFYPGDCRAQVERFLAGFEPPDEPAELIAGVVPHAGWAYSGAIAARVWRSIADRGAPSTIVLLGAVHDPGVTANSIDPEGSWETPIGDVEIDAGLARKLLAELRHLVVADPSAHDDEHSLEVQVPFIRALLPSARIVPIAVVPSGHPVQLGDLLAQVAREDPFIVVASTDLTHYGEERFAFAPRGTGPEAHAWLKANDDRLIDLARGLLAEEILPEVAAHRNACGPGALAAAVSFARARGAETGILLEHGTSQDVVPEDPFRFGVGYAGLVF
jgi:MEMO1 family protein